MHYDEKYMAIEDASPEKHEFIGGEMYAMADAGFSHNQLAFNSHGTIWQYLQDKLCRIYGSDLKVHAKIESGFAYTDLIIVCNGPRFIEGRKDIVTNSSVIIECFRPTRKTMTTGRNLCSIAKFLYCRNTFSSPKWKQWPKNSFAKHQAHER